MEKKKEKEKKIQERIEARCDIIVTDQRHMINSLLDRPARKIRLDRIVIENENNLELITNLEEVKEQSRIHFVKQFRKRKFTSNMNDKWKAAYQPLEEVQEDWFEDLLRDVTTEEWTSSLQDVKPKSAPGLLGIGYPLIKKAGKKAIYFFCKFASICLKEGKVLTKWKISQLYPILKNEEWNYNLSNIRPILLIETF